MSNRTTHIPSTVLRNLCAASLGLVGCSMLSGCLIAGFGTNSGDMILPGGLGLVFILGLLLWFLLRRR